MRTPPIKRILYVDFFGALATVVVMILAADVLAPQLGIEALALRVAGLALVPFVIFVLQAARSKRVLRGRVLAILAVNLLWLLASVLLIAFGTATPIGTWLIAAQALLILPLAYCEIWALPPRG